MIYLVISEFNAGPIHVTNGDTVNCNFQDYANINIPITKAAIYVGGLAFVGEGWFEVILLKDMDNLPDLNPYGA